MGCLNLTRLPAEMLVAIASFLGNTRDISCLARTNRRAYEVLDRYLYRFDVKTAKHNPKAFRFTCYYSLPALFAFYQEQGGNADFLVRSTKSKKARNAIFLEACESIDYKYAVDILALAADDDRKHAERWAEAASAEGWKDLAAAVAAKWNAA